MSQQEPKSVWQRAIDVLDRASKQHHVVALRDGMIASVPIILVGSTFLLLGQQAQVLEKYFPSVYNSAFGQWYVAAVPSILLPYRLTMGLLSLYVAFTIATALARQYHLPPIPQGLGAVAALLVTGIPQRIPLADGGTPEWVLPMKPLGPEGLFLAILLGILMVELSRLILRPGREAPPEEAVEGGIPPAVLAAFQSFLPILLMILLVWLIRHVMGFDIHAFILHQAEFLKSWGDSLATVVVVNVLLHVFGVAGVHGISVINAVMLPIWLQFLAANAEAHTAGQVMQYVTAYPFYQFLIWTGGAGATLAPAVLLLMSRARHMRSIGKISIVPILFNVNEPLLFGLPVVANPLLAVPFILAPVACGVVAFLAISAGLVGKPFIEVPWVVPCFLGAYLSTQDWRAVVLLAVNLSISAAIWFPFLKAYERRLLEGRAAAKDTEEERGTESDPET
ncbi:MAG: PTS sugar transporter subunit IIC [Armatimonadetes bacterium]|nr:PTS sugar transporter subunit IIC [Armatimonadota bacterium]